MASSKKSGCSNDIVYSSINICPLVKFYITNFFIPATFRGLEQMIMVGDTFVRRSARQTFLRLENCLTTSWFEVHIKTSDLNCTNPYLIGRINNAITAGFNVAPNMPKIVALILEADLINEVRGLKYERQKQEYYGKFIEAIVTHFHDVKGRFDTLLPVNGKRPGWPKLALIMATLHRNYTRSDYDDRRKFNETLQIVAKKHKDVWPLKLIQVWDENNNNLFIHREQRMTSEGYTAYWKAIDRTLVYCNKQIKIEDNRADRDQVKIDTPSTQHGSSTEEKRFWDRSSDRHYDPPRNYARKLPSPPRHY